MLLSLFPSMLLVAIVVVFLISRIIAREEQQNMFSQVPPISVPLPNPPTISSVPNTLTSTVDIPPSTISHNAFASDDINYVFPLLRQKLPKGYVHPSMPKPSTYIPTNVPPSTPNLGTNILNSIRLQRKSPHPHPTMLNKADVSPSTPNIGTHIPGSMSQRMSPPPHLSMLNEVDVPPSTSNCGTYIPSSTKSQRKSPPPHLSILNKADIPPSAPNPNTYIPSPTRSQRKSPPPHPFMPHA